MRYIKQTGIILGITMAGEWLYVLLPLPVPAGVYGLFLLLGALALGLIKLESVEGTGNVLLDIMTVLFVPATVGVMESFEQVKAVLLPFVGITIVSTFLVMIATGRMAQWAMGREERGAEEGENPKPVCDKEEM